LWKRLEVWNMMESLAVLEIDVHMRRLRGR